MRDAIEPLARKVHESWARQRTAEGWAWGPVHDAAARRHPCLVDYDRLPESEKEIDRSTARASIRGLLALGYEIRPPHRIPPTAGPDMGPLLAELESPAFIPLVRLHALWNQYRQSADVPAALHLALGGRMLKQGESILAYDVLSAGLDAMQRPGACAEDARLRVRTSQLLALALAQSGAPDRARGILAPLRDGGSNTPETLGLMGRVFKDLAAEAATPAERAGHLAQAYRHYAEGFEIALRGIESSPGTSDVSDACYCGINAAALAAMRGRTDEARRLAGRVHALCRRDAAGSGDTADAGDYWLAAARAEAGLICGDLVAAAAGYREAVRMAQGNWRDLSSTRRQAFLLARHLGMDAGQVRRLFPAMSVAVFTAPALSGPVCAADAEPWAQRLRARHADAIREMDVVCAYATATSPADLLFIESMLAAGREIHVVLPCPRASCRGIFEAAPEWAARFDDVLGRVNSVIEDTQAGPMGEPVNRAFARLRALGAATLRALRLDTALHMWPPPAGAIDGDEPGPYATEPAAGAAPGCLPPETTLPTDPPERHAIRAMLFADVKGYSSLTDEALLLFARHFMRKAADLLADHDAGILSRRTAGDGLFLVFADPEAAARVALRLRDMVTATAWTDCGLPANLGIRISLDAGPVYVFRDPVTLREEVCGAYVNRAARIEPITPPNEVYASEAFAALYVALGRRPLRFDYVGQTQLPKGYGLTPLYSCQPREDGTP